MHRRLDVTKSRFRKSIIRLAMLAGTAMIACPQAAVAGGTPAGTVINNTAEATYNMGAGQLTLPSNTHTIMVDELIDLNVDWADSANIITTPNATNQILSFTLTNIGNGAEAYALSTVSNLTTDNYDPSVTSIVIDNGDGIYDPGTDLVYVPGSNEPTLNPDQSVKVFVLSTTPDAVLDTNTGDVRLVATAATGTGTPGATVAGAGTGGSNAVFGTSGGQAADEGTYEVSSATLALVKTATVLDPFGGTTLVPGSVITYSITATATGSGTILGVSINDVVPAGVEYVAGSITLGGATLTDAGDADTGSYSGGTNGTVQVGIGDIAGGQSRTVEFQAIVPTVTPPVQQGTSNS